MTEGKILAIDTVSQNRLNLYIKLIRSLSNLGKLLSTLNHWTQEFFCHKHLKNKKKKSIKNNGKIILGTQDSLIRGPTMPQDLKLDWYWEVIPI